MDKPFALTIDQFDEIHKNLRRAKALSKLVAECGSERKEWPDIFTIKELCSVMHLIAEEVEAAQELLETCAKEKSQEPGILSEETGNVDAHEN